MASKKQFEQAIKKVLLSKPPKRAKYENRTPDNKELSTKWKLEKRKR